MNENRDDAVSEAGEQPVKAIEAAFDVICPGASSNGGGSNGGGSNGGGSNGGGSNGGGSNGSGGKAEENSAAVAQCFTCCQGVHEAAQISQDIIEAG